MNRLLQTIQFSGLFLFLLAPGCSEKKIIESRFSFVKTVVAESLSEPVQMAELPTGNIIFIERYGAIKLFDPATGALTLAAELPVVHPPEEGLLGLAVDPNWAQNHFIYLYYSPVSDEVVNQLSRFVFDENTGLDLKSEKVLIKIPVQRQECCHSGGGLQFGADSCLYIAVGDNTNATDDYAVIDERPGRQPWDAQKSASNSMDLRGKILRIKPLSDGSYICPAGNLFVKEEVRVNPTPGPSPTGRGDVERSAENADDVAVSSTSPLPSGEGSGVGLPGKPEIYIMGCRNPFRISLDGRRKLLFWADVGPDASEPDTARGPAAYDEINRAAAAGNYGWPYFIADNKAYRDFDHATNKSGPYFDPQHPFNDSPNNTGARDLPPAQPALIWYPYGPSAEFPLVDEYEGEGGRCAMVGPMYYADQYPEATRLPDHYDGKFFIYDWMRHWIMAVSLDSAGNYAGMERFAADVQLSSPVDMLIDRNGVMWVLEYGTGRYTANPDARLVRIDLLRENRAPKPVLEADRTAGAAPLDVRFSLLKTSDPDGDALTYEIDFGDGTERWTADSGQLATDGEEAISTAKSDVKGAEATSPSALNHPPSTINHTFNNTGIYEVTLKATDVQGKSDTTKILVHVGNEPPLVLWNLGGKNRSFYQPGEVLNYNIVVDDAEEGTLANTGIAPASVSTTVDYLETGFDMSRLAQLRQNTGKQEELAKGKTLVDRNDCKTCHAQDRLVNGPAYQAIAERYRNNPSVAGKLAHKIMNGGGGNWGTTVMTPHPQLSEADANEIVRWILSIGAPPKPKQSLPVTGKYALKPKSATPGTFILRAAYRDKGAKGQPPLESNATLVLRPAFQQAEQADSISKGVAIYHPADNEVAALNNLTNNSFFCFKYADLTGLHSITIRVGMGDRLNQFAGGRIELRLDSPTGQLAGQADLPLTNVKEKMEFLERTLTISTPADGQFHDLYFVFKNESNPFQSIAAVDWIRFNLGTQIR
ncbi:MAG TPA: PQQ-dependent sugar dehydrogenase [Saprospiraceae bacterium]|nr:PQQ-dependent sugar dehydrogenase [Saprospiraceae bacterium]